MSAFKRWLASLALAFWHWRHQRRRARRVRSQRGQRGQRGQVARPVASTTPLPRRPRVLWVSPFPIFPMIHGSAVRQVHLIQHLAQSCDLYLFMFIGGTDDPELRRQLVPHCRAVYLQHIPSAEEGTASLPRAAKGFVFPAAFDRLQALIAWHQIDVVQLEHTEIGGLTELAADVKVVLSEHDISFRSYARRRRLGFARRFARQQSAEGAEWGDWLRLVRYELDACHRADQVHVMSQEDAAFLAPSLTDGVRRLRVIPNGVDTEYYRSDSRQERHDLLFVGSFPHLPNLDALDYFLAEIWPKVRQRLPGARLTVAGARPPQRVLDLDGRDGLTVPGEVDDLRSLYQSHRALVVPLRAGSGTRLKILEAFASGLPIISTPLGSEGIVCHPGRHLLHARTSEDWLEAIERLLQDDALAERLSEEGRNLVVEQYDWQRLGDRLADAHRELIGERLAEEAENVMPLADSSGQIEAGPGVGNPVISILVPVDERLDERLFEQLKKVSGQRIDRSTEIVLIDCGVSEEVRQQFEEQNDVRLVSGHMKGKEGQGARQLGALNHGAKAARGEVLIFLSQEAIPQDDAWLDQLTAPFFEERSPAAVKGPVWRTFSPRSSWRHIHAFTAEARRWRKRYGEPPFTLTNAAIRRDVWSAHPFHGSATRGELAWQRQIVTAEGLILPILEAGVLVEERASVGELWRRLVEEGAAWHQLGESYSPLALLGDLFWPRLYRGHVSWLKVFLRRPNSLAELVFPWLRPLAIFCGHQLARWRPKQRRRSGRPTR